MHVCRLVLDCTPSCEATDAAIERLAEFDQQLALLVPKLLPEIPEIPLELVPGIVTKFRLEYLRMEEMSIKDYEGAQKWFAPCVPKL